MNNMKKMALLLLLAAASNSATAQNKVVLEVGTPYTITSAAEVSTSGGTVLYQWYRNGSKVEGAAGLSYTVPTEEAVGSNVKFQRAAYLEGCEERKFSNPFTITWCNLFLNGVCWADENVTQPGAFAARPDMYTEFYQWNQPNVAWPVTGGVLADITWITNITAPAWTSTPCPEGWRLPTSGELAALQNLPGDLGNRSGYWTIAGDRGNAVAGRFYGITAVRGQAGGCTLPSDMVGCIFLPAAGYRDRDTGTRYSQGSEGHYWGSNQYSIELNTNGYRLRFSDTYTNAGSNTKAYGFTIRCVQ